MAFSFKEMDDVTKFMFVLLVGVVVYLIAVMLLKPLIIPSDATPSHSMVMGDHMMNFTNKDSGTLNTIAIILAVLVGFLLSLKIKTKNKEEKKVDELSILQKALSQDEKKVIEEIKKAGEITQDSLRFRLNWSKAKISAITSNLDRMNIIQRERQGKTYNVFLSKRQ